MHVYLISIYLPSVFSSLFLIAVVSYDLLARTLNDNCYKFILKLNLHASESVFSLLAIQALSACSWDSCRCILSTTVHASSKRKGLLYNIIFINYIRYFAC